MGGGGTFDIMSPSPYIDAHDLTRRGATFILDNGQRGQLKHCSHTMLPTPYNFIVWSNLAPRLISPVTIIFPEDIHCYISFLA